MKINMLKLQISIAKFFVCKFLHHHRYITPTYPYRTNYDVERGRVIQFMACSLCHRHLNVAYSLEVEK